MLNFLIALTDLVTLVEGTSSIPIEGIQEGTEKITQHCWKWATWHEVETQQCQNYTDIACVRKETRKETLTGAVFVLLHNEHHSTLSIYWPEQRGPSGRSSIYDTSDKPVS